MSYQRDFDYVSKAQNVIQSAYDDIEKGKRTTIVMSLEKDLGSGKVYADLENLVREYRSNRWMMGRVRATNENIEKFEIAYLERLMQLPSSQQSLNPSV